MQLIFDELPASLQPFKFSSICYALFSNVMLYMYMWRNSCEMYRIAVVKTVIAGLGSSEPQIVKNVKLLHREP